MSLSLRILICRCAGSFRTYHARPHGILRCTAPAEKRTLLTSQLSGNDVSAAAPGCQLRFGRLLQHREFSLRIKGCKFLPQCKSAGRNTSHITLTTPTTASPNPSAPAACIWASRTSIRWAPSAWRATADAVQFASAADRVPSEFLPVQIRRSQPAFYSPPVKRQSLFHR